MKLFWKKSIAFETIALTLFLVWQPIKTVGIIAPFAVLAYYTLREKDYKPLIDAIKICVYILLFYGVHYIISDSHLHTWSAALTIITYGGLIVAYVLPELNIENEKKYYNLIGTILIAQSVIGLLQSFTSALIISDLSFDGANGDFVKGTIQLIPQYSEDFGNVMFATNIVGLILIYFQKYLSTKSIKDISIILLGLLVLILASVVHLLIVFIVALVLTTLIFMIKNRYLMRNLSYIFITPIILILIFRITQPNNFSLLKQYGEKIISLENKKAKITERVFTEALQKYPKIWFIGMGPGQFSSRAALIATGYYFGGTERPKQLPRFLVGTSTYIDNYLLDLWLMLSDDEKKYGVSIMEKPYYTWLSVFTEFGLIFTVTICFLIYKFVLKIIRSSELSEKSNKNYATQFTKIFIILFLIGICFFENYIEIAQSTFFLLLLLKINYTNNSLKYYEKQ